MNTEKQLLISFLGYSLSGKQPLAESDLKIHNDEEWNLLTCLADSHKVTSLLYDAVREYCSAPEHISDHIQKEAIKTAYQDFRLLFLSRDVLYILNEHSIHAVLLKGIGTASFYRNPLCRKSGDVDILIPDEKRVDEAVRILENAGFKVKEKQYALHHVVLISNDGIDIELHTMLAEPFDHDRINRILKIQQSKLIVRDGNGNKTLNDKYIREADVLGVKLTMLDDAYHAYELLLHMLQHYLRKGFGIRLLCDWVVFWNRNINLETIRLYLDLVNESGIKGFSDMITLVCYRRLGLDKKAAKLLKAGESGYKKSEIDEFMEEFITHGEFGKIGKGRMVALRGNSPFDYVREFHHQMKLNYPKQSGNVLLWPALWCVTLVRFMVNNRKIRKVSLMQILCSAGKRGKLVRKLRLFE